MELFTLTTPEVPPSNTAYHIARLVLDWDYLHIEISLRGVNGEVKVVAYDGDVARTLVAALNKVNLSTRSLKQRIFDRLIADGHLDGTVGGAVE